jgi:hypothetical protein
MYQAAYKTRVMMVTSRRVRWASGAGLVVALAVVVVAVAGFVSQPGASDASNDIGLAGHTASVVGSGTGDTIPAN